MNGHDPDRDPDDRERARPEGLPERLSGRGLTYKKVYARLLVYVPKNFASPNEVRYKYSSHEFFLEIRKRANEKPLSDLYASRILVVGEDLLVVSTCRSSEQYP